MSHGAVKSDSPMEQGVVGRDQPRRGQLVAKLVTQSVAQPVWHGERHQEQDRESHRETDRETLARVKVCWRRRQVVGGVSAGHGC